jgi:hypothetical protein
LSSLDGASREEQLVRIVRFARIDGLETSKKEREILLLAIVYNIGFVVDNDPCGNRKRE